MAAKKKQTKKNPTVPPAPRWPTPREPKIPKAMQVLIDDLRVEQRERHDALVAVLGRIALGMKALTEGLSALVLTTEATTATHQAALELMHANREEAKNVNEWIRVSTAIMAEERGLVIENALDDLPVASDMADSEWRAFIQRQIRLREIRNQEDDAHAEAQRAARKDAKAAAAAALEHKAELEAQARGES